MLAHMESLGDIVSIGDRVHLSQTWIVQALAPINAYFAAKGGGKPLNVASLKQRWFDLGSEYTDDIGVFKIIDVLEELGCLFHVSTSTEEQFVLPHVLPQRSSAAEQLSARALAPSSGFAVLVRWAKVSEDTGRPLARCLSAFATLERAGSVSVWANGMIVSFEEATAIVNVGGEPTLLCYATDAAGPSSAAASLLTALVLILIETGFSNDEAQLELMSPFKRAPEPLLDWISKAASRGTAASVALSSSEAKERECGSHETLKSVELIGNKPAALALMVRTRIPGGVYEFVAKKCAGTLWAQSAKEVEEVMKKRSLHAGIRQALAGFSGVDLLFLDPSGSLETRVMLPLGPRKKWFATLERDHGLQFYKLAVQQAMSGETTERHALVGGASCRGLARGADSSTVEELDDDAGELLFALPAVELSGGAPDLSKLLWQRILGAGAFGQAHLCKTADDTHQPTAAKVVHIESSRMKSITLQEDEMMRCAESEFVLKSLGSGMLGDFTCVLLSEFADAGTLADHLRDCTTSAGLLGWRLTEQLLKGVKAVHSVCICHRDLKPDNLLVQGEGNARKLLIADFGLAATVGSAADLSLQGLTGTPGYMAPELLAGQVYGLSADVWSAGIVVHQMLTGSPRPLDAENLPQILEELKSSLLVPRWQLLTGMLGIKHEDRLTSAGALAERQSVADASAPSAMSRRPSRPSAVPRRRSSASPLEDRTRSVVLNHHSAY